MNTNEKSEFTKTILKLAEMHGRNLTAGALSIYCNALDGYSLLELKDALSRHVKDSESGKYFPLPAHLIAHLHANDGRPSADEMWAIVPKSESDSVVWTTECAKAFFDAALPLLEDGDETAARMAFRAAYDRAVAEARQRKDSVKWIESLGHDEQQRKTVLQLAITKGRITVERAKLLLPHVEFSERTEVVPQ